MNSYYNELRIHFDQASDDQFESEQLKQKHVEELNKLNQLIQDLNERWTRATKMSQIRRSNLKQWLRGLKKQTIKISANSNNASVQNESVNHNENISVNFKKFVLRKQTRTISR
jgi:hypothetical protein